MVANRYHIYAIPGQRATIIKQDELFFLKRQCDEKSIAFYHMMCCIRPKLYCSQLVLHFCDAQSKCCPHHINPVYLCFEMDTISEYENQSSLKEDRQNRIQLHEPLFRPKSTSFMIKQHNNIIKLPI